MVKVFIKILCFLRIYTLWPIVCVNLTITSIYEPYLNCHKVGAHNFRGCLWMVHLYKFTIHTIHLNMFQYDCCVHLKVYEAMAYQNWGERIWVYKLKFLVYIGMLTASSVSPPHIGAWPETFLWLNGHILPIMCIYWPKKMVKQFNFSFDYCTLCNGQLTRESNSSCSRLTRKTLWVVEYSCANRGENVHWCDNLL